MRYTSKRIPPVEKTEHKALLFKASPTPTFFKQCPSFLRLFEELLPMRISNFLSQDCIPHVARVLEGGVESESVAQGDGAVTHRGEL